jgi:ketosteroid isomerase-like protein
VRVRARRSGKTWERQFAVDDDVVLTWLKIINTKLPPIRRIAGRQFVERFFTESRNAHFDVEELITAGDRALVLWRYSWADGHVRGADVMRVRDGRVAESLAYVKG